MATAAFIKTLKYWYGRGLYSDTYIQSLVPTKLTQAEYDEILGVV